VLNKMANNCYCKITCAKNILDIIEQKKIEQDQEIEELEDRLLKAQINARTAMNAADDAFYKYIHIKTNRHQKKKKSMKNFYI
jgi:hypothetical protein